MRRRPLTLSRTSIFLPVQKPGAHWVSWNWCWCCMTNSKSQRCNGMPIWKGQVASHPSVFFCSSFKTGGAETSIAANAANLCRGAPVAAARAALRTSALCANDRQCLWDVVNRSSGDKYRKYLWKKLGCNEFGLELQSLQPFPFLTLCWAVDFEKYGTVVFGLLSPGTLR